MRARKYIAPICFRRLHFIRVCYVVYPILNMSYTKPIGCWLCANNAPTEPTQQISVLFSLYILYLAEKCVVVAFIRSCRSQLPLFFPLNWIDAVAWILVDTHIYTMFIRYKCCQFWYLIHIHIYLLSCLKLIHFCLNCSLLIISEFGIRIFLIH